MKLIEGMQVTVNGSDVVGIYIGESYVDLDSDGRVSGVLYSGGNMGWARQSEIRICDSLFNRRLVSFTIDKLRYEVETIEHLIYELEAEERYDD